MRRKIILALTLMAGTGMLFWGGRSIQREHRRNQQIQQQIDDLKAEAERIRQENGNLSEKIAYFETPDFREKVAKEKLNLQREGENVVIIKPSQSALAREEIATARADGELKTEIPNYLKWWRYFFE